MESKLIYDPNKIICSKPQHIGRTSLGFYDSFFASSSNGEDSFKNFDVKDHIENCLKKYDKFKSVDHIKDVEKRCNVDLLKSDTDQSKLNFEMYKIRKLYNRQEPDPTASLETLKNLRKFEKKIELSKNIAVSTNRYLKYRSSVIIANEVNESLNNHELTPVITIRTYFPYRHEFGKRNSRGVPKFDREFKVLGVTKLKELRDALSCPQDLETGEEKSNDLNKSTTPDGVGSALFYINGILYIDERYPYEEGYEYAKNLQDWGQRKNMDIRIYDMNNLCFNDIFMRLGYPNVYQHRGCCEHIFIFSDIECVPKELISSVNKFNYPLVNSIYNECKSYCMICYKYMTTWVSINNKRTMSDEFLWCNKCFLRYNYTEDMKKIGEFDAYRYLS